MRRPYGVGLLTISSTIAALVATPAMAAKVRILAGSTISATLQREPSGVVIRGTLHDDVGAAIPNSHVSISVHEGRGSGPPLPLPPATRCAPAIDPAAHDPHIAPDEYVVDTDARGAFCVQSDLFTASGTMKLRFVGTPFHEREETSVPFDLSRPPVSIAFDPDPQIVSLDQPQFLQGFRATGPRGDWHVALRDERAELLGEAVPDEDGYGHFDLSTTDLGGPGPGEFALTFEGLIASPVKHAIERHARVQLKLSDAKTEGNPEEGIPIAVEVGSSRGPVPSGAVEALLGNWSVGTGRIHDGKAVVVARFGAGRATTATATLRYLPDTPWWEPGSPLDVPLRVHPPSLWRRAPLVLLALALGVWMARNPMRSFLRRSQKPRLQMRPPVTDTPLQITRTRDDDGDWTGCVVDAHDGHALAGARISIVVPGFPGAAGSPSNTSHQTTTAADGRFTLPRGARRPDARLRVEGPYHASFEEPLPPPSEMTISLTSRRRRLLEQLVRWSRREWGASSPRDPTPSEVVSRALTDFVPGDQARAERASRVTTWARAVERVAYGRGPVDEPAERDVLSSEPPSRGAYDEASHHVAPSTPRSHIVRSTTVEKD